MGPTEDTENTTPRVAHLVCSRHLPILSEAFGAPPQSVYVSVVRQGQMYEGLVTEKDDSRNNASEEPECLGDDA